LEEVDTKRRRARFRDRQTGRVRDEDYQSLVSTIPIPELVRRCTDFPTPLKEAADKLRWVSVYNVNLGFGREHVSDKHWLYFPEPEISHRPTEHQSDEELIARARTGMERAGIVRPDDEMVVADVKDLPYAYVYFDRHRAQAVPAILEELGRRGIYSIGRYGRWEHTSMEDAIAQGKRLAERIGEGQARSQTA
jgi:protoporphyrinogen oxidase